MNVNAALTFFISYRDHPDLTLWVVTPAVNNISLATLVTEFESEEQFDLIGGYGGLLPQLNNFGPLDRYYFGEFEPGSYYSKYGIDLLGCGHCGEVGCWPLKCQVKVEGTSVVWLDFLQPHRRERSYSRFGPFVFELAQYKEAVREMCADLKNRLAADDS